MSPPPRPTKTRWKVVPTGPATGRTESGGAVGGGGGGDVRGGGGGACVPGRGVVVGPEAVASGVGVAVGEAATGADGAPEPAPLGRALAPGVPDRVVPATELPAPPSCVTPSTTPPTTSTATAIVAAVFVGKGCSTGLRNPASLLTRSPSGMPA